MAGGLCSFGDALKAFRRGVYQFPFEWRAIVVCANPVQVKLAMDEAARIIEASSLKMEAVKQSEQVIHVERGGMLRFCKVDGSLADALAGRTFPHIILLCELPADGLMKARLLARHRHDFIDPKYFIWQEATL